MSRLKFLPAPFAVTVTTSVSENGVVPPPRFTEDSANGVFEAINDPSSVPVPKATLEVSI